MNKVVALILACVVGGCATSPREDMLYSIKRNVDSQMVYEFALKKLSLAEYMGGVDRRGNCTDFSYTYMVDAKAKGESGAIVVCWLPHIATYHAAYRTADGYILDNRYNDIYKGESCK